MIATIQQINSFLLDLKYAIQTDNIIIRTDRPENEAALLKLMYTPQNAIDELLGLTYKDYHKGPETDKTLKKGDVWKFGRTIKTMEIYIKINIISTNQFTKCVCISFHEPRFKLTYPYKPK